MPEFIGLRGVVKMGYIEEFGIDNNELERNSKEESFFIGAEYGLVVANCIHIMRGIFLNYQNEIHSENLKRVISYCKRNKLQMVYRTINDDWVQVLISK